MSSPPVLSVSQVEDFDSEQLGGCPRRWWFERVQGHRVESTAAHEDGHQGHALLARYLTTGERPGRVRLGKAVNAVIDSGCLPRPGPHLQVEHRFSGQPHYDVDGRRVPLDASKTLWHVGHPWEGFIDLRFRHRDGAVTVWDHKFSSDIHARALPAEKLIRTVQMPIYALDTLRQWSDATAANLVHLYVSRRGVESFIRHQRVSVEQVQERAAEIAGLVRQMDAVRGVTAQDDVPFNRAACQARMGCPSQFRCNAFKRRTTMDLTDEEKRMFGMLSDEKPVPAQVTKPPERPIAGPVTAPADLNLDDIFDGPAPMASAPKAQPSPTCEACGEVLTPENSSRLKTGDVKHIGCQAVADTRALEPIPFSGKIINPDGSSVSEKCPDCPHPVHAGKPCEGKRGRGACRCGAVVEQPKRPEPPPAPKFELTEEDHENAKKAEEAIREAEREEPRVDEAREHQREADRARSVEVHAVAAALRQVQTEPGFNPEAPPEPCPGVCAPPAGSRSGTLAVNVTVELGPSTLAFLVGLVKR